MLIDARKIDDFKTERKDLMPPLPMVYRLVPILFYLSLLFIGVVGSAALWHSRVATQRYQAVLKETAALQKKIDGAKASRSELEKSIREATDLENWVLASMPLQPLVVEIIRSVAQSENSTIVDLGLERDPETPSQLRLALTLNTDSDKQIESTLKTIQDKLNYREFSPTQSMVRGNLEYRASLLWRNPEGATPFPQKRAEEIVKP
jgi:cell division protein FtsB